MTDRFSLALGGKTRACCVCFSSAHVMPFVWGHPCTYVNPPTLLVPLTSTLQSPGSTMCTSQSCEVTLGRHFNQKPGICKRFINYQTIWKNVPISNLLRWESVGQASDKLDVGIKVHMGHMGPGLDGVRRVRDIVALFLECRGLCN